MSIELLIVDPHVQDREGIAGYFSRLGLQVRETGDAREGQTLVRERFYPLVLVDVDVEPWGGLEFLTFVRGQSPRSEVALLTTRRAWDVAVGGFRRGATEVVFKDASDAPRLKDLAERVARRWSGETAVADNLPAEAKQVLDEMLARLLDMSQHVPATQSRLVAMVRGNVRVAVVDHEAPLPQALVAASQESRSGAFPFEVAALPSGGAALDQLSGAPPDILVTRDDLFDLPGTTLLASLQETSSDLLAIVYHPTPEGGEAALYEGGHAVRTIRPLTDVGLLVREVKSYVERASAALERRRVMDLFRLEHSDLLRRYSALRGRLEEAAQSTRAAEP
jgi:DNA-binding NtrC family response regulator